jgi:DNA-binding GntR family transcriptional regulator
MTAVSLLTPEATPPTSRAGALRRSGPVPVYAQIADDLADRISADEFPGRLPGERTLAAEYRVAYLTLRHAMDLLRQRGLIITSHGRASRITPPGPRAASL